MKMQDLSVIATLIAALNLLPPASVTAQTFTTLYSFTGGSDGATPYAGLITNASANTLYGTTSGGSSGAGTVFAVNTDGSGFTNLHIFTALSEPGPIYGAVNSDGANPQAGLILSGNTLYGTAAGGGSSGAGTVFSVNTGGTAFTILRHFEPFRLGNFECTSDLDCRDDTRSACGQCAFFPWGSRCILRPGNCPSDTHGGYPYAGLILSGNTLYGTASGHGFLPGTAFAMDPGTVFAVDTNGANFTQLYGFGSLGSGPKAGLILSGDSLYGTTPGDGSSGAGTVFALRTSPLCSLCSGTVLTGLHSFTGGSDGAGPVGGLITNSSGTTLYGTAVSGGNFGNGTVFAVNTDGTDFTNLHSFTGGSDGANPQASLILSGSTLYGTASAGGSSGKGTVFALNTDGTGFTTVHTFAAGATNASGVETNSDGANPHAGLILSGNTLYGTASAGGSSGNGTVFSILLPPRMTITRSGSVRIVTYTSEPGRTYRLQYRHDWTAVNWNVLGGDVLATGPTVTFFEPSVDPWRLYRVVLLP